MGLVDISKLIFGNSFEFIPFKLKLEFAVYINIFNPSIISILISPSGNFLTISNKYFPWITIVPVLSILSIYFLSIKHSISISLFVAVKNKPSFVKLNFFLN